MRLVPIILGILAIFYVLIYRARRRKDYHTITLENALKHMKTGDLILFSGRHINKGGSNSILRRAVFLATTYIYRGIDACEWGHVAMVFKKQDEPQELYLLHCEMSSQDADQMSGVPVTGVQVTRLVDKLSKYQGYCLWRPLNRELPTSPILNFLKMTYALNYSIPGNVWMRFVDRLAGASRVDSCEEPRPHRDGMFCTEWLGTLLEYCKVFNRSWAPYRGYYLPSDFNVKNSRKYMTSDYYYSEGFELMGHAAPSNPRPI
jgi:hypothetical protein